MAHLFNPAVSSIVSTQKTSVSERWLTSSTRLSRALCQHIRPPSQSASGGSPLQPGCLEHCVNTEDLRLRAVAHLFNPAVSSVVSTQKTSVSERWLTSSTRLSRALCQHRRPPSPSGGSPLQPGCLERCVNTEDLRLRAVAHLFNPAVSSVVSTQKTSVSERWLTSSTRLFQTFHTSLCRSPHVQRTCSSIVRCFMALATTTTTETVDLIDDLCSRKEGWLTIVPIDRQAAVHAPSERKNHYSVLPGVPDEVLTHLKNGLYKLFDEPCYNNVALESAVGGIIHELSFPIIAYRGEPKEASVREGLILPILSTIYQHAPMIPTNTSSGLFDVRLVPEDKIELRRSSPGRRPEIDYIASVENSGNGTIIKFIL